jgi:hypothetical protein
MLHERDVIVRLTGAPPMPINFKHQLIDNVLFTRWSTPPSAEDVEALKALFQATEQRVGDKYVYVTSIPSTVPVPNADQRKRLNEITLACRNHSPAVYLVIEGAELQHNLQRAIISGMLIFTKSQRDFLLVHKDGASVGADLSKRMGINGAELVRKAREMQMLA